MCLSNPLQDVPTTPVTFSHVTQGTILHTTLRCRPRVGFKGGLLCHYLAVDSIKNNVA